MFKRCAVIFIVLAAPLPAFAFSELERMVLEELSCVDSPQATHILQALVKGKKISPSENIGYDSISCWKIDGGISISGMTFQSVCALEEDEFIRSHNPDLYYLGPGLLPAQRISFGASVSADVLSDWYFELFGPVNLHSAISEGRDTTLGDASEVRCTAWMQ